MADDEQIAQAENLYEIKLTSIRGEEFLGVVNCTCVKTPFYKKASFWMLKVSVSSIWAQQLINELASKTIRLFRLEINGVENESAEKSEEEKVKALVHKRVYKCISAMNSFGGYKINIEDQNAEIIMTLVDYIFFDLSIKKSFNRKFEKKKSADVITSEYKEFLKEKYGDDAFTFNNVGITDDQKSSHEYPELLIALMNDLQVTDYLLYNKKAMMNLSFYFFDDFHLEYQGIADTPYTCHFINVSNIDEFETYDISESMDNVFTSTLITEIPIEDTFRKMVQGFDSMIFREKNMTANTDTNNNLPTFHPKLTNFEDEDYYINDKRATIVSTFELDDLKQENKNDSSKYKERENHLVFYSQDSDEITKTRLKNFRVFIERKIKQFVKVQVTDCFCDWLQFGRRYNFDITNEESKSKYLHTPIAIQNIFYREGNTEYCKHMTNSLMLEFYDNEGKNCEDCKHYNSDKYCILHSVTVDSDSWCYDFEP